MKKALVFLMLAALMLTCTALGEITAKGVLPIVDEPYTLVVATPVNAKVEDITTNRLTKYIEEMTGITLEFIQLSPSDTATQVNMIMTSGESELPDVFMGYNFSYAALCSYVDAGLIAPLDEYIAQYGDNYFTMLDKFTMDNADSYARYNGKTYAVVTGSSLVTDTYGKDMLRVQSEFLDALDMELPSTLDELYDFLVGVRDNDVNGNGDPDDEIPMAANIDHNNIFQAISQAFQYTDTDSYLKITDGEIEFIADNELFKEAVEYVKMLVDEGLIDPASWTQDGAAMSTINAREDTIIGAIGCMYNVSSYYDAASPRYKNIRLIALLEGPHGYVAPKVLPQSAILALVVTTACERPDIAFRLFDFMVSTETAVAVRIGFEGEQWVPAEPGESGRDGFPAKYKLIDTQEWVKPSTNVIWNNGNITYNDPMNSVVSDDTSAGWWTSRAIADYNVPDFVTGEQLPTLLMSFDDATEYADIRTRIINYVNENVALFVLSYRPMDEWDAYVAEFESMGLERYIELAQAAYDAMQ